MSKEIKTKFVVSAFEGNYWIEIMDEASFCITHKGLMGFSLSRAQSSKEEAQKVADFLNSHIDSLLFTPF